LCSIQEIFSSSEGKLAENSTTSTADRDKDSYSGEFDQHSSTIDEVLEPSQTVEHASQKTAPRSSR